MANLEKITNVLAKFPNRGWAYVTMERGGLSTYMDLDLLRALTGIGNPWQANSIPEPEGERAKEHLERLKEKGVVEQNERGYSLSREAEINGRYHAILLCNSPNDLPEFEGVDPVKQPSSGFHDLIFKCGGEDHGYTISKIAEHIPRYEAARK